jgi:hypothetical protein
MGPNPVWVVSLLTGTHREKAYEDKVRVLSLQAKEPRLPTDHQKLERGLRASSWTSGLQTAGGAMLELPVCMAPRAN